VNTPQQPKAKFDQKVVEIVFEQFKKNINLIGVHLRDARNLLVGMPTSSPILSKAAIVLASAALEANLAYFCSLALRVAETYKPKLFNNAELYFLRREEPFIDEKGTMKTRPQKQTLEKRLTATPALLGRCFERAFQFPKKGSLGPKLRNLVRRRDCIAHPSWDAYLDRVGLNESAEAVDAVELYLHSVQTQFHPNMVGYLSVLYTIPGHDKHEIATAYRTAGKRATKFVPIRMDQKDSREIIVSEWMDALFMTKIALDHPSEGDSDGSMLTRAALILMFGMIEAELAAVSYALITANIDKFEEAEVLFMLEKVVEINDAAEVSMSENKAAFKHRIVAVPQILSRRILGKELQFKKGNHSWQELERFHSMRSRIMHPPVNQELPRVTKDELVLAWNATKSYFVTLNDEAPQLFSFFATLVNTAGKFGL